MMSINGITSYEVSKRMVELNYPNEGRFYWEKNNPVILHTKEWVKNNIHHQDFIVAPTAGEIYDNLKSKAFSIYVENKIFAIEDISHTNIEDCLGLYFIKTKGGEYSE